MNPQELTEWLRTVAAGVTATKSEFPLNVVRGCPIPFFGKVLNARVLTVGVNPSNMEFAEERQWSEPLSVPDWQERLLNYFNWPDVPAYGWFETWSICLKLLNLGYAIGEAAHIDISPRPTTPMLDEVTDKAEFRKMTEHDVKWFFDLLANLTQVQLLLVAGPIPRANGSKQQLADFIREQAETHGTEWIESEPLPSLRTPNHPEGIAVFVCPYEPGVDGLYAMVRQVHRHRELLLRLSAPPVNAVPILPARLDWPSAIGSYLLNFGSLEYFVFAFLKDHLPEVEFEKVNGWHLVDRLKRIAQFLADKRYPQSTQDHFAALVARLTPLREIRNQIAHGQLHVIGLEEGKPRVVMMESKHVDRCDSTEVRELEFAKLERALTEIAAINREFQLIAE